MIERKVWFEEQRHQHTASRLMVISPMIDARAPKVAKRLGMETYGDSSENEFMSDLVALFLVKRLLGL